MKSSQDTEVIPQVEAQSAIQREGRNYKAHGIDGIPNNTMNLEGLSVPTYLTNIFNRIRKTNEIPESWHEPKILI